MTLTPEQNVRFAKAIAIFDAKRELLRKGWDLDTVNGLKWAFDVQELDGKTTASARYEDTGANSRGVPAGGARDGATVAKPPLAPPEEPKRDISVALHSGGTLRLSLSVEPCNLRGDDRTIYYDILDRLTRYQEKADEPDSD